MSFHNCWQEPTVTVNACCLKVFYLIQTGHRSSVICFQIWIYLKRAFVCLFFFLYYQWICDRCRSCVHLILRCTNLFVLLIVQGTVNYFQNRVKQPQVQTKSAYLQLITYLIDFVCLKPQCKMIMITCLTRVVCQTISWFHPPPQKRAHNLFKVMMNLDVFHAFCISFFDTSGIRQAANMNQSSINWLVWKVFPRSEI